jgi:hypothetical protein
MRKMPQPLAFLCILLFISSLAFAQDKDLEAYRPLLLKNAARLGVTPADVADAVILQAYTDKATRLTFVYLQQSYQHIKVYNAIISAAFIEGDATRNAYLERKYSVKRQRRLVEHPDRCANRGVCAKG